MMSATIAYLQYLYLEHVRSALTETDIIDTAYSGITIEIHYRSWRFEVFKDFQLRMLYEEVPRSKANYSIVRGSTSDIPTEFRCRRRG